VACTLHVYSCHVCLCRHNCRSNILTSSRSLYSEPAKLWIKP
jgi:hypothetical protein